MSSKTECTNLKGKEKLLQELQSLSQELYDMREDDRDSHNQILQVFSATGTVLAVFLEEDSFLKAMVQATVKLKVNLCLKEQLVIHFSKKPYLIICPNKEYFFFSFVLFLLLLLRIASS